MAQNVVYTSYDGYSVWEDSDTNEFFVTRSVRHPSGTRDVQIGYPYPIEDQLSAEDILTQFAAMENIVERAVHDQEVEDGE